MEIFAKQGEETRTFKFFGLVKKRIPCNFFL